MATLEFDIDAYAAKYSGHPKVSRLEFIATHAAPSLAADALRLAIAEVKLSKDTLKYKTLVSRLASLAAAHPDLGLTPGAVDEAWVATTDAAASAAHERLEADLVTHKANQIKESIRNGHNDLGDFFYDRGKLDAALGSYLKSRDYCTASVHVVEMCLNVVRVSLEMTEYLRVESHVSKAEHGPEATSDPATLATLKAYSGIAFLGKANFKDAAKRFLEMAHHLPDGASDDPENPTPPAPPAPGLGIVRRMSQSGGVVDAAAAAAARRGASVVVAEDAAVYAGLCALAGFTRGELQEEVVGRPAAMNFLGIAPGVRGMVADFMAGDYSRCLRALGRAVESSFSLDIYLREHIEAIQASIKSKAMVQYLAPYQAADLGKMAAVFDTDSKTLQHALADLIAAGKIPMKLDVHAGLALRPPTRKPASSSSSSARPEPLDKAAASARAVMRDVE
eukprot:CAMPEP_0174891982 /NCGR_PEP_ID=MMETSP0167-20121228/6996_1 /TAXON_ID=38298 /ORGANISM="Rhodella maculata, Strain CCMP736" /LENGTH=449 /DNA_ID=CAMNT_0016130333 /DNA_START=285 /DNA_END=1631 /DNA_ORIENTATION=-